MVNFRQRFKKGLFDFNRQTKYVISPSRKSLVCIQTVQTLKLTYTQKWITWDRFIQWMLHTFLIQCCREMDWFWSGPGMNSQALKLDYRLKIVAAYFNGIAGCSEHQNWPTEGIPEPLNPSLKRYRLCLPISNSSVQTDWMWTKTRQESIIQYFSLKPDRKMFIRLFFF